jgi:acyl-CoA thioesterase-2
MSVGDRIEESALSVAANLSSRLALAPNGSDEFVGQAPPNPPRIYGGELAAQALAAANGTVESDRTAHVLQATYLAAGDPAQLLHHQVARVRDGRSFSTRTVRVRNAGRMVLTATVGYHIPEQGLVHQQPMPSVPPPEELPTIANAEGTAWTRWAVADRDVEMHVVPPDLDDPTGRRRFWCRIVDGAADDLQLHTALVTYLSDFTMVASIRLPHEPPDTKKYLMSTLNHTVYFHRPVHADDWMLIDHHSPVAAGGRGLAVAHVYSLDGRLTLTAVQEGLIRPLPEDYS